MTQFLLGATAAAIGVVAVGYFVFDIRRSKIDPKGWATPWGIVYLPPHRPTEKP